MSVSLRRAWGPMARLSFLPAWPATSAGALMADSSGPALPTPTVNDDLEFRVGGFDSVPAALDYAAQGLTGYNFFNLRGELSHRLSYRDLREQALQLAARLAGRFERGDRIAMVAETGPDFLTAFFACQYAGLVPAPMPMPVNLGGKEGYINQVRQMIAGAQAAAAVGPSQLLDFLNEAAAEHPETAVFDFAGLS
ncbi:MAG: AMP-binding protein, partial [Hyphococcus sp.]